MNGICICSNCLQLNLFHTFIVHLFYRFHTSFWLIFIYFSCFWQTNMGRVFFFGVSSQRTQFCTQLFFFVWDLNKGFQEEWVETSMIRKCGFHVWAVVWAVWTVGAVHVWASEVKSLFIWKCLKYSRHVVL